MDTNNALERTVHFLSEERTDRPVPKTWHSQVIGLPLTTQPYFSTVKAGVPSKRGFLLGWGGVLAAEKCAGCQELSQAASSAGRLAREVRYLW